MSLPQALICDRASGPARIHVGRQMRAFSINSDATNLNNNYSASRHRGTKAAAQLLGDSPCLHRGALAAPRLRLCLGQLRHRLTLRPADRDGRILPSIVTASRSKSQFAAVSWCFGSRRARKTTITPPRQWNVEAQLRHDGMLRFDLHKMYQGVHGNSWTPCGPNPPSARRG